MDAINYCILLLFAVVQNNSLGVLGAGAKFGEACKVDKDCQAPLALCERQLFCTCLAMYDQDEQNQMCIANVGGRCWNDVDCSNTLPNSECFQSACACVQGYVPSSNNKECLAQAISYGDPCTEVAQCTKAFGPDAECDLNKCLCKKNYHYAAALKRCIRNKPLGDPCTTTNECFISDANDGRVVCEGGLCSCKNEFYRDQNDCTEKTTYGSPCIRHEQCTKALGVGAQCVENKCICLKNYHFAEGQDACIQNKPLGDPCPTVDVCFISDASDGRVVCEGGLCSCKSEFLRDANECTEVTSYGSRCTNTLQCTRAFGTGADCIKNQCLCLKNYHFAAGTCIQNKPLNDSCTSTEECLVVKENDGRVLCRGGKCSCKQEFVLAYTFCIDVTVYGSRCTQQVQCTRAFGPGTQCKTDRCLCTDNYHFNDKICAQNKALGDPCQNTKECFIPNLKGGAFVCQSGACSCQPGFHKVGNDCQVYVPPPPPRRGASSQVLISQLSMLTCLLVTFLNVYSHSY